jgi:hypothetical protein
VVPVLSLSLHGLSQFILPASSNPSIFRTNPTVTSSDLTKNGTYLSRTGTCSVSRWRPQKVDKRMVLEHTHGLFIT